MILLKKFICSFLIAADLVFVLPLCLPALGNLQKEFKFEATQGMGKPWHIAPVSRLHIPWGGGITGPGVL